MKKNYYAAILLLAAVFILPFHSHAEQNNNKIAESPENQSSIIREDLVWEYINKVHPNVVAGYPDKPCLLFYHFFRFNGETEINGVTYHNLYCRFANELTEKDRENPADGFDFTSAPNFYIRQEGQKYYMLRNYVSNYEQDMFSGFEGYGSETVESVIYDFSPIPEDSKTYSYEICTGRLENGEYLNKIYTLDGKVKLALPTRYTSDLSGIGNIESDNSGLSVSVEDGRIVIRGAGGNPVEIFSMDGAKVYSGAAENLPLLSKGIYLLHCGARIAKIAL